MIVSRLWPCAALFAMLPALGAQATDAKAPDLTSLSIPQLLDRLPTVDHDTERGRDGWWVPVPVAAELLRRLDDGQTLSDDDWTRALLQSGVVRVRDRWPADEPFAVSMAWSAWLPITRIELTPRWPGLSAAGVGSVLPMGCGVYAASEEHRALYQELGMLPKGHHEIAFDVTVAKGARASRRGWTYLMSRRGAEIWSGTLRFDVEVVDTVDDVVVPVQDPRLDELVRRSIGIRFKGGWGDTGEVAVLAVSLDEDARAVLGTTALSLDVELLHDGDAVERHRLLGYGRSEDPAGTSVSCTLAGLPAVCMRDLEERAEWTLRIRGIDAGVLGVWESETRWNGTLKMAVDEAIERETARRGSSGRQR